jgi:hypothetical protein
MAIVIAFPAMGEDSNHSLTPAMCRDNARTCRELAQRNSDPRQRDMLGEIARAWDDLARELDHRK